VVWSLPPQLPCAADTLRTVKLESSITTTRDPSAFVTCTSYAAFVLELSVSVVALVTVPPGTAASAAAEAEDSVVPVSGVCAAEPELDDPAVELAA